MRDFQRTRILACATPCVSYPPFPCSEIVIPAVIFSNGVLRFGYLPFRGPRGGGGGGGFQQWRNAVGVCEDDSFVDG
jgi:hypothetical protein